jgi:antitoxin component YwqK of YwqJK toxin-antitoxin module
MRKVSLRKSFETKKMKLYNLIINCGILFSMMSCYRDNTVHITDNEHSLSIDSLHFKRFDDGSPSEIGFYRNGLLHGKFYVFDDSGAKIKEMEFRNGKINGVYREFFEGKLLFQEEYKNGEEHGNAVYYISGGDFVHLEGTYQFDKKRGYWIEYDAFGVLRLTLYEDDGEEVILFQDESYFGDGTEQPVPRRPPN